MKEKKGGIEITQSYTAKKREPLRIINLCGSPLFSV